MSFAVGASCEEQVDQAIQEEANEAIDELGQEIAQSLAPFALPTRGYLVACWDDPDERVKSEFGDHHTGIDVWTTEDGGFDAAGKGSPVYAAYNGAVVESGGEKIEIAHDSLPAAYVSVVPQLTVNTYYTHLSERKVEVDARVVTGQLIGYQGVGNGIVHLHFSVKKGDDDERYIDNTLDPGAYLKMDLRHPDCGLGTERVFEPFGL